MKEVWKDIPMYAGIYEVSNLGQVRSKITGAIAKCGFNHKGYLRAYLYLNGRVKKEFIHRLVALTFIPNPNGYPYVNHKDECKTNNRVDNLEWCTAEYNNNYGDHNNRVSATLGTPVEVDGKLFTSITKCAKYLDLPVSTVNNYLTGRCAMPIGLASRNLQFAKK